MAYKVLIADQAYRDLRAIFEYIAYELRSIDTARNLIESLEENISSLNFMPYRFAKYNIESAKDKDIRALPLGNYLILYMPKEEDHTVNIIRVIYGGKDIETVLFEI